ncbi:glycosyltransferase family 2 protein [Kitasatospora sp. NPDC048365]|uniref:glycosyltransferase family 2 protein n=1 Tax=Kitasatospora sp. NPDC048365 TaxID=3364050 RepID=UPI0037198D46
MSVARTIRRPAPRHAAALVTAGILKVVAVIPAHNEQEQIAEAIGSLLAQRLRPARIVVIADNCTDATAEIAARYPVEVVTTVGNRHRKAGALNQVLEALLPTLDPWDAVLVMDADSVLDPGFIKAAVRHLADPGVPAVGGTFAGKPGGGLVGALQRNEYARYARDLRRRQGKTLVLTGTATLFRAHVLDEVLRARRAGVLRGGPAVYDTQVLTEDNELTLAIRHLGHRIIAPPECTLLTEVMPTWADLFRQRLRWKRGAIENLKAYGWTPVTREYWARQLLAVVGLFALTAYLVSLVWAAVTGGFHFNPLWTGVTAVIALERIVTVRSRGPAMMALAGLLIVEMAFDIHLQAAQAKAFWDTLRNTERTW